VTAVGDSYQGAKGVEEYEFDGHLAGALDHWRGLTDPAASQATMDHEARQLKGFFFQSWYASNCA